MGFIASLIPGGETPMQALLAAVAGRVKAAPEQAGPTPKFKRPTNRGAQAVTGRGQSTKGFIVDADSPSKWSYVNPAGVKAYAAEAPHAYERVVMEDGSQKRYGDLGQSIFSPGPYAQNLDPTGIQRADSRYSLPPWQSPVPMPYFPFGQSRFRAQPWTPHGALASGLGAVSGGGYLQKPKVSYNNEWMVG